MFGRGGVSFLRARVFLLTLVALLSFPLISFAASSIPFTVILSEPVVVNTGGGTPRISIDVGGTPRYATYSSGSGTANLVFTYQMLSGDIDANGVVLSSPIQLNGGTIRDLTGNDANLNFAVPNTSGVLVDGSVPSGYSVAFVDDTVTNINKTALSFVLTYTKTNRTYSYSISSSGGGTPVTGTGTTTGVAQTVSGINVTSLPDGILTLSLTLTDSLGGAGIAATDTIPMAVLDASLVGHWTLDTNDISGATAYDRSGNGFHGTTFNAPPSVVGKGGGRALSFNGTSQYIEVPYTATLNPAQFSFSFWAQVTGGAGNWRSPLTSRMTGGGYLSYAANANNWQAWTGYSAPAWAILTGGAVSNGTWIHIAATYSGGTYSLYQNGAVVTSGAKSYSQNTSKPLRIGAGSTEGAANYFMTGLIDDVRVYNRALSAAEVAKIYTVTQ